MHLPTIRPQCGQMGGGRQQQEAGGRITAASSLSWCKLTTSPLQAVAAMATRPVTPKPKWIQGPGSREQFLPTPCSECDTPRQTCGEPPESPQEPCSQFVLLNREIPVLGFQVLVFVLTPLSNLGEGLGQTNQCPGAPGPCPPIAHHALQKSSNAA